MDVKLYAEVDGQTKLELEPQIKNLTDLFERFGVKEVTINGQKVLAREALNNQRYEYHMIEPHGGKTLQSWMDAGKRLNLWVAYGETENIGTKATFKPFETYVIKNLLPHTRVMSGDNQVSLFLVTLERPVRQ